MRRILLIVLALGLSAPAAIAQTPATAQAAPAAAQTAPAKVKPAAAKPKTAAVTPSGPMTPDQKHAAAVASFLLATIVILVFSLRSEVLRDSQPPSFVDSLGPADTMAPLRKKYQRSFSLSQTQMMWWFWIVISSYLYIAWKTWSVAGGLTQQALMLTGIGIATAVGAAIIDQSKKDKAGPLKDLNDAETAIRDPATAPADLPAQYKKLNDAANRLKSVNFLADILSDMNGVSMHRFQSLAWTVVLGGAFLIHVFSTAAMPQFDALQLSLLGISAGTYLGLKIPEQP